jgi:hypothetical protein
VSASHTQPKAQVPLLASGALVLRGFGPRTHLGLVERAGAWGLPRAMLGEQASHIGLARQACAQQLGCDWRPTDFVGSRLAKLGEHELLTYYWTGRGAKTLLEFQGGERVRWIPLDSAAQLIDYPEERTLVSALASASKWSNLLLQSQSERRRACAEASVHEARIATDRAQFEDPRLPHSDSRWATCLGTAREATHLPGAAAQELAHTLLAAAEVRDLAQASREEQSLRAVVLAEELRAQGEPEGLLLAAELRSADVQGALARVLQTRARVASDKRVEACAMGALWQRHMWSLAVLFSAPMILGGQTLDPDITAINLPWYAAVWAGLLGACLTPRRTRRGLQSTQAWIGGLAGLGLWLLVIATVWSPASGPPAALAGAAVAGAVVHRLRGL